MNFPGTSQRLVHRFSADRPWMQPAFWAAAAGGLVLLAVISLLISLNDAFGVVAGVVAGLLALAALLGGAWALGRLTGRDAVAEMLRAVTETSRNGRFVTDRDGRLVFVNGAARRLFHLDEGALSTVEVVGERLAGGEAISEEFIRLRANASLGVPDHAELPISSAGEFEWRRIEVRPVPGQPGHAVWRIEDVTARREFEESRRREEALIADFLDHLPVGFFSADADGRLLYVNQTLAAWLGAPSTELADGRTRFVDFVAARETEGDRPVLAPSPDIEGEVTLRTGAEETFTAFVAQTHHLAEDGMPAYSRSVVLRDAAPAAGPVGRGPAQRLRWLFDEAPVGIALLDLHGAVTDCNRALLKLLGVHRSTIINRPLSQRIRQEDRSDVAAQLSKVVMGISRAAHLEVRMPGARGRELVISLFASRMEDGRGEVSGLIVHFIDTTQQKHLEVQFAQSQKMQAVGQLAGGVAHDFNNLLTAMVGFCDLLLERHGPEDPSFADIMQVKQNVNRATNLVRQLLAFSRKQTLQPVMLDVTESLNDMSNLLRRLIGENIQLTIEHGRDLGLIRADRGQFDQVIINLAVNARDAMPSGGEVVVRTSEVTVGEPVERGADVMPPGHYVLIEVSDTGIGISKENIGRIFEPFFSTKEVGAGTGLGLSTVYGIVRQTDGYVFVDSAEGEGTTFSVYLPRYTAESRPVRGSAAAQEVAAETAAAIARAGGRSLAGGRGITTARIPEGGEEAAAGQPEADLTGTGTVLLVEDEDAVRMFGCRALRNKGYHVLEAADGETALEMLGNQDERVDLVISDVVMPGMDGHTLVRMVRKQYPEVKVILMSGYAEDVFAGEGEPDPSIRFLPKPFTLKVLAGTVKEVMMAE